MAEEQKSSNVVSENSPQQDPRQLQALLKETLKENKSLQNKNSKLESKYVELFKQNKLLKQDRTALVSFAIAALKDADDNTLLQEPALGQCNLQQLNAFLDQRNTAHKTTIQQLSTKIEVMQTDHQNKLKNQLEALAEKLNSQWQSRVKGSKQQQSKEANGLQREIESLKKTVETRSNQVNELKSALQARMQELSKISKEKLKMEHHLNNIRKKQISKEITPPEQPDQSKTLIDKNQYLSLRQQVQTLMAKKDQLRKELKKKDEELAKQRETTQNLQKELQRLTTLQRQCDQKYELVRECSLEDLENMIISFTAPQIQEIPVEQQEVPKVEQSHNSEEEIQREYLKNMVIRYLKAQTSGNAKQALTLLEIIGRLVKLENEASEALGQYIGRRKQWWYIKY